MKKFLDRYFPIEFRLLFKWIIFFMLVFFAFPLLSYLSWQGKPSAGLEVVILDKTVPNKEQGEFQSIQWVLNHLKYTKTNGSKYLGEKGYFGYYLRGDQGEHEINDFSNMSLSVKDRLVQDLDLLYISDTYGVYENDFTENVGEDRSKKIYGGMNADDLYMIKSAYEAEKVVITEFNSIASPTSKQVRTEFENLMEVKWTGWIGRYFDELNIVLNEEIPDWMITTYKNQHDGIWDFNGSGIIFLHENGRIEVMRDNEHLRDPVPSVVTNILNQKKYGLSEVVKYPYWFDILLISREYEVISHYDVHPTPKGIELLNEMGLPRYFPAVIKRRKGNGSFYYFAGDYSDNRITDNSYKFQGLGRMWRMFLHADDFSQRRSFFWNYYYPLMKEITKETYSNKTKH
ncbi:hypothetical protein MM213_18715 [Belliella sp. R4-6]|uniref:Uncharacterized protein n=1 Tax=Belliella alkalica TaxID=1730871 RepID=A0ABS9VGH8_9BACT|nr:hypothetical protein [Belliella alkalica]MCH7415541.1 hypothetical protein [Belliella alkalica]